jgi:hypothetical protein
LLAFIMLLVLWFGSASNAQADVSEYGIESVGATLSTLEAGRHPDVTTEIHFNPSSPPFASTESLSVELPPGLVANPQKFPTCSLSIFKGGLLSPCPQDSQVGVVEIQFVTAPEVIHEPLYLLDPPEDEVARLGFIGLFFPYILEIDLRSESDYGVTVRSVNIPSEGPPVTPVMVRANTWGVPADTTHDPDRLTPLEAFDCGLATFVAEIEGKPVPLPCAGGTPRHSNLSPQPFMTNPANCGPAIFDFKTTAYGLPGQVFTASASAGEITDCDRVPFDPSLSIEPTSHRAGAPTGLEVTLAIPNNEAVNTVNSSPLRSARVTLPEGMVINASAADGLQGCTAQQAAFGTPDPAACPSQSRMGSATIVSSSLKRPIDGSVYLRTPEPGHLTRFWLVSNELGVNLKLPAEVEVDQSTGRLTTIIEESPQLPAQTVVLRINGGARAPLRNPESCGTSSATYELEPWSGRSAAIGTVPITIDQGCDGGTFKPKLSAGTISSTAGSFSPFIFDVTREDGEQNISTIDVTLPKGLAAKFAGIPLCPESMAAAGACPTDSQIGIVRAAVGAGSQPLWVPQAGKSPTAVYLAGPYRGAPYSVVASVPAQAGPFDLGLVAVRSAIYVNPETVQGTVKSDPLPQILQGIPIAYRRVRVEINRNKFTLNPTSCAVQAVEATIGSIGGLAATPSDRFQAADCASLGFSPTVKLSLKGGTSRGDHPRLRAVVTAKPGQANVRRTIVALPHSEFLEQAHIRTVCTRVQFAAQACPNGSMYGHARVTTPLLDQPLSGPVYLRSSNHKLPDLVIDLGGLLHVTLVGRIDSLNGGIRTTFASVPDAPFHKLVLNMAGGKKGLLVNSTNLCDSRNFAAVQMDGQNGRRIARRIVLRASC